MFIIVNMSTQERTPLGLPVVRSRARILVDVASIAGSVLLVGVSYGALATGAGLPPWFTLALSVVVLGASAELIFVGGIVAGASPMLAALGALLVNLRNALYGLSAGRYLPEGRSRLVAAHLVNDETAAYGAAQTGDDEARRAFRALAIGIALCWPGGAGLGILLGSIVPDTEALGLDAVFPAILLAMVVGAVRRPRVAVLALAGAAVAAAATPWLALGIAPILGLVVLVPDITGVVRRTRRRAVREEEQR